MHVKRVYRATVREALAAAREQLGPGALVLSTELVPAPGWRGWIGQRMVRLTAAAERGAPGIDDQIDQIDDPALSANRPPLADTRQFRPAGAREGVVARLTATGLDELLAKAVVARMSDAECRGGSDLVLRRELAAEISPLCAADEPFARCEVFVGPPGAGKTTTIAKIVARQRVTGGPALGLVAADAFRAGAVEQLRTYATVLDAPFRVARSADELDQALSGSRCPSLVDTAGRSNHQDGLTALFSVLASRRDVRTHLVMAADTSASSARRILDRYAPLKPARVVITKLDETDSAMPLVSALRDRGLPVSYLTAGQRVPEDLWRATPVSLAAALLREPAQEDRTCQ